MTPQEEYENLVGPDMDDDEICPHCHDWPCRCLFQQEEMEYA